MTYRDSLNPAAIGREIADLQSVLLKLAKGKTEQLYLATFPSALPDFSKGIRINKSKAASCPTVSRAFLVEARSTFRGHIDLRH